MSLYLVHIILILIVVTSFHLHIRNANEVIWQFWDGKFSIRHSRHIPIPVRVTIFPHSWLSSCGKKKNPPLAASPLVEDFFFTTPAKPFMGKNCDLHRNWDVPFVTHREFQNSSTRGFAARGGIFPSQNRQMTSLVHCHGGIGKMEFLLLAQFFRKIVYK